MWFKEEIENILHLRACVEDSMGRRTEKDGEHYTAKYVII